MTDPLSERLEKALLERKRPIMGDNYRVRDAKLILESILPILRDEIAAAEEASLTEFLTNESVKVDGQALARHDAAVREWTLEEILLLNPSTADTDEMKHSYSYCAGWGDYKRLVRALKTPQPEVSK